MYTFAIELGCAPGEETRQAAEDLLNALAQINARVYQRFPRAPCCPKCAGFRYKVAKEGPPRVQTFEALDRACAKVNLRCGTLAAMAAGRELAKGRHARVKVELEDAAENKMHALVELEDGRITDPSAELVEAGRTCNCV